MSELRPAAREDDDIAHTASKWGLIGGLVLGAVAGAAITVATGGTALLVVAAGTAAGAAAGGGLGEVLGGLSHAPKHVTGQLIKGSDNVFINGRPAIRAHLSAGACDEHAGSPQKVAEGSDRVFINGWPAARKGDKLTCSGEIHDGSANVLIGGGTIQTDDISPEIPAWVNWTLMGVGIVATAILAGPLVAAIGAVGGAGGGLAGDWIGGEMFGEGSDGQKLTALVGSILGAGLGVRGVGRFNAWRTSSKSLVNLKRIESQLATDPDTAFFWSGKTKGVGGAEVAESVARSRGGVTLESRIKDANIKMPEWDFDNPKSIEAWQDVSAAYAKQVSGEVRAVVGESLRDGNIWETVELPRLIGNPRVTKITTIDPLTQAEKVIFDRGIK